MTRYLRLQDIVLALLLAAMAALDPEHDAWTIGIIAALGILQILESKIPFAGTTPGKVTWILLKLALGYLLIGLTHGLNTVYYLILLLPVVSAATALGAFATLTMSLLACSAYFSFVLFLEKGEFIPPEEWRVLVLRLLFIALAGNLVNDMADALREQNVRYKKLADELARAEAAVRRSERLAALGQLSAGLAHELRNPLGTIKASAEMLTRNLPSGNELAAEMAGFISTEVDRTNSLVTRFLDFARPLSLKTDLADVTKTIDRAIQLVEREESRVPVLREYAKELPPIPLDAEMMEHVFYNLILNAVQASANGSPVTVKTKAARASMAEIDVTDRGSGIEPDKIEAIFNPFMTTKPTGVGLGLPIVAKIVDEHGGKIKVESVPGKGATFRVFLPTA